MCSRRRRASAGGGERACRGGAGMAGPQGGRRARKRAADAVVVGAGIAGLSTAYHLAMRGRRILVVDRSEPGSGASGRNGGHLSPGVEGAWAELGRRALDLWPAFAGELGDVEFRQN